MKDELEKALFVGIFFEENLQKVAAIETRGSEGYEAINASRKSDQKKIEILDKKFLDFTCENWRDAEILCLELEKQFQHFFFIFCFEYEENTIELTFYAIEKKNTRIKNRKVLQERALTYEKYYPDYKIDFKEKIISRI